MLRVINNVSTTYCKSQNHIVSPAHADTRHTERPLFLSPRASRGPRAARFCVHVRARPAGPLISSFHAPVECGQSRVLRFGNCSGDGDAGVEHMD
jgi:hypothetical protein